MTTDEPRTRETSVPDPSRGSWHRRATKPITWWLLVLVVLGLVHRWVPSATWVLVHSFTLGLLTNSILVWGQHFVETLLHRRAPDSERRVQVLRIYALNAGIVVLTAGMIASWPPAVVAGAVAVGACVTWYALDIVRQLRAAGDGRFRPVVRFYPVAAALLPVGAGFGAWMGVGARDPWDQRVILAHLAVNVLGFVGITVFTTLVTFWAMVLRTRMPDGHDAAAVKALWLQFAAVVVTTSGALLGSHVLAAAGLGAYTVAVLVHVVFLVRTAAAHPPREFAPLSIGCGLVWLLVALVWMTVLVATGRPERVTDVTGVVLAGFGAQVLFGAMSYLMPTVMRGGPAAVRAGMTAMNRLVAFRLVLVNAGLAVYLWPGGTSWTRVVGSSLAFLGFILFVPIMMSAVVAQLKVIRATVVARESGGPRPTADRDTPIAPSRRRNLVGALAAAAVVVLATGSAVGLDPASPLRGGGSAAEVTPNGDTTTVRVTAKDMRFEPSSIVVPKGDRLVVELVNADPANVHDLYLPNGANSGRVQPGETVTLDAGVVGADMQGWCTIAGHKAMGMTFDVDVTGGDADTEDAAAHAGHGTAGAIDLMAPPGPGYVTRDPVLRPAPGGTEHRVTLTVQEREDELAPGVRRPVWTYNGRVMAPTLRGRVGDTVVVTLVNDGTMGHSIDFHAGDVRPDEVMRTIAPGERLEYRFRLNRSGIWLYHCGTMPMTGHLSAGMFGAVVADPPDLPEVDREYLLVQSESYLGAADEPFDTAKIRDKRPDLVMFNGHANQYTQDPLVAKAGERVRIWVLAAGPSEGTSFHVVGGQFDTVYKEGAYLLQPGNPERGGSQALDLAPAQGGFVEMVAREPGRYIFVDHSFADAEKGARGFLDVTR